MHAVRYAPAPRLPDAAIRQRLTGTGVYAIDVDAGGQIGDVRVVRSAGHKILDDAAVEALRKWIFRPRTVYKLTLSITFTGDSTTVGRPQ